MRPQNYITVASGVRALMQCLYPMHAGAHAALHRAAGWAHHSELWGATEAPILSNISCWSKCADAVSMFHVCRCSCGPTSCSRMGTPTQICGVPLRPIGRPPLHRLSNSCAAPLTCASSTTALQTSRCAFASQRLPLCTCGCSCKQCHAGSQRPQFPEVSLGVHVVIIQTWWQGTAWNDISVPALQVPYTLTVVSPSGVKYESADNLIVASSGNGIGNLTAILPDLAIPAGENLKANVSFTVNATSQV